MKYILVFMLSFFFNQNMYADELSDGVYKAAQATTCLLYTEKKMAVYKTYDNIGYHVHKLKLYGSYQMEELIKLGYHKDEILKLVVNKIDYIDEDMKSYSWRVSKRYEKFCMPIVRN